MADEQRMQAYEALIEQLLSCPQGEEANILQNHPDMVDAGLLAAMEQVAVYLEEKGNGNAQWLRGFATQLAQGLGLETVSASESEDAAQFLRETLRLVYESKGNPQQVYPVWAQQQARFNETLLTVLPAVAEQLLVGDAKLRTAVAAVLSVFGNLIQQFPLGACWLNLKLGITAYQQALMVMTREDMPAEWAEIMMNLATAYTNRTWGDHAQNIEDAIATYQQALEIRTRETMPIEWATTMMNLAFAYSKRIRGDRAQNVEESIAAYQQSLQVMTRETMPIEWATTMMNLASAYRKRIWGDHAQNIEDAIAAYQQSLTVMTCENIPIEWAKVMVNLANAYYCRIQGDHAQNIEDAIAAYQQSLQVMTRENMPTAWAITMMNLASAYSKRIRGDRTQNIEEAITVCQQSLTVMTHENMPVEWAQVRMNLAIAYFSRMRGDHSQNIEESINICEQSFHVLKPETLPNEWAQAMMNLAIAYSLRVWGDRAQNIEKAIAAHQQALTVMTRESTPIEWAQAMTNLAGAYYSRVHGERADNFELAIAAYQQALTVMTQESMPIEWAQTMLSLATAYFNRIRGDKQQNLEQAIAAYHASLNVFDPESLPNDCRRTARSLGNCYSEQQNWQDAVPIYQTALHASETLYQSANLLDSRAAELEETADLPRRAAYGLARAGDLQAATLTLERGRARGLSETLERDRSNLFQLQQTHPALFNQYQDITAQLRNLEAQQRSRMTSEERHSLTPEVFRTTALQLRQTLMETIEQIRQVEGYVGFLAQPDFSDIQLAIRPDIPLIYLVSTPLGSLALIVTQTGIADLWLDELSETDLIDLLNDTWFSAYDQSQTNSQGWLEAIDQVTQKLWQPLMAPLMAHLKQHSFHQATLISTGYLSLLPLHAAWTEDPSQPTGKRYALDEIVFTYAPNARSLTAAAAIAQQATAEVMAAIDNPLKDLPNSSREVAAAIASFPQPKILKQEEATVESVLAALTDCNFLHLSCHGTANLREPLNSGLAMSDGLLTLRQFLDLKLSDQGGIRLVVLSACETGLVGTELADEAISLPTGLLQAGVAGVIASLWSVSDLSTMLLLSKFYELWRTENQEPSEALRQAQVWLRDSTEVEIAPLLGKRIRNPTNRPFFHPYHWAAFVYTGV